MNGIMRIVKRREILLLASIGFILVLTDSTAEAQIWERKAFRLPNNQLLTSRTEIFFNSRDTGWLHSGGYLNNGNYIGDVLRSTDAGDSWQLMLDSIDRFYAFNATSLWAIQNDSLLMSVDGGRTWDGIQFHQQVQQMYFSDRAHGLALIPDGEKCLYTSDGGRSWLSADSLVAQSYKQGFSFPTPSIGWMVADRSPFAIGNGMIARTNNGGKSWIYQELYPDYQVPVLHSVLFVDTLHGIATGPGHVLTTSDGGNSWSREYIPTSGWAMAKSESNVIYASGWNGDILYSDDRGKNWQTIQTGSKNTFTHIYAEGTGGKIVAFARISEAEGELLIAEEVKLLSAEERWTNNAESNIVLSVYPMPFMDKIHSEIIAPVGEYLYVSVFRLSGQMVYHEKLGISTSDLINWEWQPSAINLDAGSYMLVVYSRSSYRSIILQYNK